jgi:hypothetical protein
LRGTCIWEFEPGVERPGAADTGRCTTDGGRTAGRVPLPPTAGFRVPLPATARFRVPLPATTGFRVPLPAAAGVRVPLPAAAGFRVPLPASTTVRVPLSLGVVRLSPSLAAQSRQYVLSPSMTAFSISMRVLQPSQYWSCMGQDFRLDGWPGRKHFLPQGLHCSPSRRARQRAGLARGTCSFPADNAYSGKDSPGKEAPRCTS